MLISRAAFDLIVREEVSSEAAYRKKYVRPIHPGGESGVTVGIGYDLRHHTPAQIRADWDGRVDDGMIEAMVSVSGQPGSAVGRIKSRVSIPWEAAISEFEDIELPRWEAKTARALPGFSELSPDCKGALVSLTFNRGPSFAIPASKDPKGRYREMRAIRTALASGDLDAIPDEFRAMKRLWPNQAGLRKRRDAEAALFERGLRRSPAAPKSAPEREPTGDEDNRYAEPTPGPEPIRPVPGEVDGRVILVQRRLKSLGYSVGNDDGDLQGLTVGAIASFRHDRNMPLEPIIDDALMVELSRAEAEVAAGTWKRPIAPARAEAKPEEVAKKIESVDASRSSKLWAWILGIPSAITAFIKGIADNFEAALESPALNSIKEFFADNVLYIALAILGVAAMIWWKSQKAESATVKAYQEGRLV